MVFFTPVALSQTASPPETLSQMPLMVRCERSFILCFCSLANLDSGCPGHHSWPGHAGAGGGWYCGGHRGILSDLKGQHTFHDLGKGTEMDTGKHSLATQAAR